MRLEQVKEKYELMYRLQGLEKELAEQQERHKYAVYGKREAEARALEYKGSFQSLIDGFSGKREAQKEAYTRAVSTAAAELEAAKGACTRLELQIKETTAALEQIPEFPPSGDPQWNRGCAEPKAKFLVKITLPLIEENLRAMEMAKERRQPQLRFGVEESAQGIFGSEAAAHALAKQVRANVQDLNECLALLDLPAVELGSYFLSPEAFLVTAFQYGTLDQMNKAMEQMYECRKGLRALRAEFE